MRTILPVLLAAAMSAVAAPALANACAPVAGAAELASGVDFVVVGEVHGTAEIPRLFLDAVCSITQGSRPVIVGIEHGTENQPALDAYLASDGGEPARTALLAAPAWSSPDGRSSRAMLDLVEGVRLLSKEGRRVSLLAFDHVIPEPGTTDGREAAMASALMQAHAAQPDALLLVLTGQGHADHNAFTRTTPPFPSMVRRLPAERTRSIVVARTSGEVWACRPRQAGGEAVCGVHPLPAPPTPAAAPGERGIRLHGDQPGFNGVATAGNRYTASPPALDGR